MDRKQKRHQLYLIVLQHLTHKVTENLRKLFLDIDFDKNRMILTAIYKDSPTELELELLDDIVTNSNAPIPDFFVEANVKLLEVVKDNEQHDFVVFAFFDALLYNYNS